MSDVYNANSNRLDEEQSEADQALEIKQNLSRYPNLLQIQEEEEDEEGAFSHDSVVVASTGEARDSKQLGKVRIENEEVEEEPSDPRGFYYSFDYPVQLILENSDDRQQRSVLTEEGIPSIKVDETELNLPLEAEVAGYKIVKRSENSKDAEHVPEKDVVAAPITGKSSESPDNVEKADKVPAIEKASSEPSSSSYQINTKTIEAQIPVRVEVEAEEPSSNPLLRTVNEWKNLATNSEVIDAVHDVQVHRHVQA